MTMNFAICTDENYAIPALVTIASIFENNSDNTCRVSILTDGLSSASVSKVKRLAEEHNQTIDIIDVDATHLRQLKSCGRYPSSMYLRLMIPNYLKDVDTVLYLDCDILVRRPLNELFTTTLQNCSCGVVIDQQCDDIQIINRLNLKSTYFNSGIMLMNLTEWRKNDYTNKVIDFIDHNPNKCVYPDQDALNVVLSGTVKYINLSYNLQEMWLTMLDYARFSNLRYPELEKAKDNPHIIHFCVGEKPWYYECENPYKTEYLEIASLHNFIGFRQRHHYHWLYYRLEAEKMRLERWKNNFVNK